MAPVLGGRSTNRVAAPAVAATTDRRAAVGALAAGVTAAALIRKGAFFLPDAWVFPVILAGLAVAVRRVPAARERPVLWALGGFGAWWLVASLAWGVPARAPLLLGTLVGFAAAFLIGRSFDLRGRTVLHRGIVGIGCATAVVGLAGVVLRAYPYAMPHDGLWRVAGTLTYANSAGLLLAVTLPLAVTLEDVSPWLRRLSVFVILTALLATLSRGPIFALLLVVPMLPRRCLRAAAWPALMAVTAAAACLAAASGSSAQPALAAALVVLGLLAAAGAPRLRLRLVVALALFATVGAGLLVTHPAVTSRTSLATVDVRYAEWSAAFHQLSAHPVAGGGPERNLVLPDKLSFAYFAHNEYLQIGAGGGAIALALLALIVLALARLTRRHTLQSEAAIVSLLVFAVGGLFDFTWHAPALGIVAGWIAALSFEGDR